MLIMVSLNISLLLVSIILNGYASNYHQTPYPWHSTTRKVNNEPDNNKNCFCFPEGDLPTVNQLLDSQNKGQERVVIYIYKNRETHELIMFTPSQDKQLLIPDIPYESGDGLIKITSENVFPSLYNNPYRIRVFNDHYETHVGGVTESLPIGLKVGEIQHIYPKEELTQQTGNYDFNEYSVEIHSDGVVANEPQKIMIPLPSAQINLITARPKTEYFNTNPQTLEPYWSKNYINYPYQTPQIPSDNNVLIKEQDQNVYSFRPIKGGSINFIKDLYEIVSTENVTFNIWFTQQMKRFQNINLANDIKAVDSDFLRFLVQQTLYKNKIYVNAEGVITDSKGNVIDASNLELRPMFLGEKVDFKIINNFLKSVPLPKNLPYLEGILVGLVSPPQLLGIIPLGKTYLLQTSYQGESWNGLDTLNGNHIYVDNYENSNSQSYSSQGPYKVTVEDSYTVANIGPSSYYTYSSETIPGQVYSEVHMETSPPSYKYSGVNKVPTGASEVTYWSSEPHNTASISPVFTSMNSASNPQSLGANPIRPLGDNPVLPSSNRRKLSEPKIEHHYEPPIKSKPKGKKKLDDSEELTTIEPFMNVNTSESGRRFPTPSLKNVMKTLMFLLNDLPSRREFKHTNSTGNGDNIVNDSEDVIDGGGPDFRIIGGNAATGSGTPLSNKGRSGYIENA